MPRSAKPNKARRRFQRTADARANLQRRPHIIQVHRTFAPIYELLRELRSGEALAVQGRLVMRDWCDDFVEVAPALDGWVCCWERIVDGEQLPIDLRPLRQLQRYIASGVLLTVEMIDAAEVVSGACERAYAQIPRERLIGYSRTELIAIELDALGLRPSATEQRATVQPEGCAA